MKKLALLGAAAVLTTTFASPLMAQGVTQEPGSIGFNYPNSRYVTGSYGVGTPYNTGRYPRMGYHYRQVYYGPVYQRPYYGPGPGEVAAGVVGGAIGTAAAIAAAPFEPYDSYDYYYDPY
ncbi:hypothetical protein [Bradyrhizobium sp. Ai1a-2]|uniref:hypothetical protein n=1 Tax=Bradyrhizobium sp. Ai1a-2 TaxID=196490 RepID=UPI00041B0348|nr:hypothetical protein [Bradyrhizobium sp. Ai1a-2]